MARILYDLAGADPARRFSPYCWRIRLALAHKGLEVETRPWRFTDKAAIAFSDQDKVPVLVDGGRTVSDSWTIAGYLDATYPDRPALFPDGPASPVRFVAAWADTVLNPAIFRLVVSDIVKVIDPGDRAYFRTSREQRLGATLESVTADRDARLPVFRDLLTPLRVTLQTQDYLGGAAPDYADYAVFGSFMWPRCVSAFALLATDDPVHAWRERMLDAHDGLARAAPHAGG